MNELADLARLFGISATELLEPQVVLNDDTDIRALEAEIVRLEGEQERLEKLREARQDETTYLMHQVLHAESDLIRVMASLETLRRWHPKATGDGDPG